MGHELTSKDICSIIDKCAKSGVSRVVFGDLQLEFNKFEEKPVNIEPKMELLDASSVEQPKKSKREEFEELLEESKYLDPVLYERLIELDETTENI